MNKGIPSMGCPFLQFGKVPLDAESGLSEETRSRSAPDSAGSGLNGERKGISAPDSAGKWLCGEMRTKSAPDSAGKWAMRGNEEQKCP